MTAKHTYTLVCDTEECPERFPTMEVTAIAARALAKPLGVGLQDRSAHPGPREVDRPVPQAWTRERVKLYHWIAWSSRRAEILDCGWIAGETRDHARANASLAASSAPRVREIKEIEVKIIQHPINGER